MARELNLSPRVATRGLEYPRVATRGLAEKIMSDPQSPVVLELAPLPREQMGPFVVLGVDKDANREQVEAAWAQRVIAARKNQVKVPLEDINWAREVANDPDRRPKSEVTSLNPDTAEGTLRQLAERYGLTDGGGPFWQPWDEEKPLADYTPAVEVPSLEEIRGTVRLPEMPFELPAVGWLLEQMIQEPLDPWSLTLSSE